jgi:hypothetical protein
MWPSHQEPFPGQGIHSPYQSEEKLMLKTLFAASSMMAMSTVAFAQSTVIITEPAPVETGTVIMREAPSEVRTYVMEQDVQSVPYEGDVLVGRVLPQDVQVRSVDGHVDYGYTVVNERRVLVNPNTREVIQILD